VPSGLQRSQRSYEQIRSDWPVILIKNIYTLWGLKSFLLPATYFSSNTIYHFTLRETGKKTVL